MADRFLNASTFKMSKEKKLQYRCPRCNKMWGETSAIVFKECIGCQPRAFQVKQVRKWLGSNECHRIFRKITDLWNFISVSTSITLNDASCFLLIVNTASQLSDVTPFNSPFRNVTYCSVQLSRKRLETESCEAT